MNKRLVADNAEQMARALLYVVRNCIREDENRDAFIEFVAICKQGIEAYEMQRERMMQRLKPSKN